MYMYRERDIEIEINRYIEPGDPALFDIEVVAELLHIGVHALLPLLLLRMYIYIYIERERDR